MEKERGYVIVGASEKITSSELPEIVRNPICEEVKTYTITNRHTFPEIWVNPNAPVFNEHKHKQTCAKNRKKRKKKKRNK